ncbi:MAG TPA: ABC transporter permease [Candidatus Babeliales bacterium]|nr:ABC transporter permease [Candidatus Babeliales bacterium]
MVHRSSLAQYCTLLIVGIMYLFLYIPIIVLMVFSFNSSVFPYVWKGATLEWYAELWRSSQVWDALYNSLLVACMTVVLSVVMGVSFVLYATRNFMMRAMVVFYGTLAAPEIVLAVGLLSFFSLCSIAPGFMTLVAAHTLLGLGYVVPIVYGRYSELNYALIEASFDLGATRSQTYWRIIIPLLKPSILAAGLLVFIISLNDFVISFFCSGSETQTLPMYIFSMIRSGTTPVVNVLSTVLMVVSGLLVLLFFSLQVKKTEILS